MLGTEEYALPIEHVREIIRYTKPRPVASTEPWIQGVLSLRGHLVPVHDLAERLGATSEVGEHSKIVIVETGSEIVGVIVDGVEEVLMVDRDQIEVAPGRRCGDHRFDRGDWRAARGPAEPREPVLQLRDGPELTAAG